jgi:tetratricopeptide (TPR) repeat protein
MKTAFSGVLAAALLAAVPAGAALDDAARAEIFHQRGAHALRQGDTQKALEWLWEALKIDDERPDTLALYARALLEAGRPADAEQVMKVLRRVKPGDGDVSFLLGVTAYRQQDWITARQYLEEARDANPSDARVRLYLGRAYQELGEDSKAIVELNEAVRLDPEMQGPAAYRLAILHLQRSENDEAKDRFKEVIEVAPGTDLAKSAETYLKIMEQSEPQRVSYWVKLGAAWDSNMTLAGAEDEVSGTGGVNGWESSLEVGLNARLVHWKGLTLRAGFDNYVSFHNHEHDFDIKQVMPWALATYQPVEWLAFDARFTYEQVWRNWESESHFKRAYYTQPAIRFIPRPGWVTKFFWEHEDHEYYNAFEVIDIRDRDGQIRRYGLDQYIPLPNPFFDGPAYLRVGYRYREENSDGPEFDSRSHRPLATIGITLPWGFDLTLDGSWEYREFARPSLFEVVDELSGGVGFSGLGAFPQQPQCNFAVELEEGTGPPGSFTFAGCDSSDRLDQIAQTRIRLRKSFGRNWTVEGYYNWTDWSSDVKEFDFNRHFVGLAATFRR